MGRFDRFTFVCTKEERELLEKLSKHLERSQSDAVRFAIRKVARELIEERTDCDELSANAGAQRAAVR